MNEPENKMNGSWRQMRMKLALLMCLALVAVGVVWTERFVTASASAQRANVADAVQTATTTQALNAFSDIPAQIAAKAAVVMDGSDQSVLYDQNSTTQLPLASLTKMMTMLVALDILPLSATVEIAPEDLMEDGDSGLLVGEKWRLSDLIGYTLMVSSNDGAAAIARTAGLHVLGDGATNAEGRAKFIELMNAKALDIGLLHTHFLNPTGLDIDSGVSGAYGTAEEVAKLALYVWSAHPEIFEDTTHTEGTFVSASGIAHHAENTHQLPDAITGITASKTGFTDLAGGNLAVIFEIAPLHPIVVVALGSSTDGRFSDVRTLAQAAVKYAAEASSRAGS